jgi:hypothetical protein
MTSQAEERIHPSFAGSFGLTLLPLHAILWPFSGAS